jgi:hypothetical protein
MEVVIAILSGLLILGILCRFWINFCENIGKKQRERIAEELAREQQKHYAELEAAEAARKVEERRIAEAAERQRQLRLETLEAKRKRIETREAVWRDDFGALFR